MGCGAYWCFVIGLWVDSEVALRNRPSLKLDISRLRKLHRPYGGIIQQTTKPQIKESKDPSPQPSPQGRGSKQHHAKVGGCTSLLVIYYEGCERI